MHELKNSHWAFEVAKPHETQVAQRNAFWQSVADQNGYRLGYEHLATMRRAGYARGPIHRASEEIVVSTLVDACVQSAAHAQSDAASRFHVGERLLQFQYRADRIERVVEGGVDTIAGHLDYPAAMDLDRRLGNCVVARQCRPHPLRFLFPQANAALDVGKQ